MKSPTYLRKHVKYERMKEWMSKICGTYIYIYIYFSLSLSLSLLFFFFVDNYEDVKCDNLSYRM